MSLFALERTCFNCKANVWRLGRLHTARDCEPFVDLSCFYCGETRNIATTPELLCRVREGE